METSLNRIIDDSAKRDSACLSSTPFRYANCTVDVQLMLTIVLKLKQAK